MIRFYGEQVKGKQASESAEMVTFFNQLKKLYPEVAKAGTHIRNEGKRTHAQTQKQKAEGMVAGASDIFIHGCPSFACEMKSLSKSSKISDKQIAFLDAVDALGAFACVAYGYKAALLAVEDWLIEQR
tara:strand:+ start:3382 stop:3765 length:384 start_codon:yes stop_codon:yes gene_type:complete